ncbi:MAG: DUF402 domain-containing protein [Gemmatimonadota bacterium]|nr:MAG: DUF402 domain-containing protein [Gemmatimonadota bacterium]
MRQVEIHYRRPPDRLDVFTQTLVVDQSDCKITLHENPPITGPLHVAGLTIFEPGAPIVWYVFPNAWHDVGRFHLRDGSLSGFYVNLITPVEIDGDIWRMYDLCLDLWIDPDGRYQVLDQDEFDEAVDRLWIDRATARRAREELDRVIAQVRAGAWPPPVVRQHDLSRVRALLVG